MHFYTTEVFWVGLAFVVLVLMIARPVVRNIIMMLDKRSEEIKNNLEEAVKIKEDAKAFLASCERKYADLDKEVDMILKSAEKEAIKIVENTEKEVENETKRRIKMAEEKIAQYKNNAIADLKKNIVSSALENSKEDILNNINQEFLESMFKQSVKSLNKKLH